MSADLHPVWPTPKQAETYSQCDVATLRRAVKRGALRAFRINGGSRVRFRAVDLDTWLQAHPVENPDVRS